MRSIWAGQIHGKACVFLGLMLGLMLIVSPRAQSGETHILGFGFGTVGILDADKSIYEFVEYRSPAEFYRIKPWVSLEFSEYFFYGAAGILLDFEPVEDLFFTPSFGAGFYTQDNGVKLGHPLEFRSAAELSYRFGGRGRLAIIFGHLSNGGLDDTNPGSEFLKIAYLVPLGLK